MQKPATTIIEQIDLLKQRGIAGADVVVGSDEHRQLMRWLMNNSYYRLSGYWRYHQKNPHAGENWFISGSVADVKAAYDFDTNLRSYLSEGLAVIEVTFRSRLAYFVATELAPDAYLDPGTYVDQVHRSSGLRLRDQLLDDIARDLDRSKERFIAHHVNAGRTVPMWAAVEAMSFGTVSKIYALLDDPGTRTKVSKSFEVSSYRLMESIVRSLVTLRNTCAHHGRVWNRIPDIACPVLNQLKVEAPGAYQQTPWGWVVMVRHLVDRIRGDRQFSADMNEFLDRNSDMLEGLKYPRNH
ncbi:MAG: Abi family protein [Mycobacterium sp.]